MTGRRGRSYAADADRITQNVKVTPTGCWQWQLYLDENGYARLQYQKRPRYGHRFSYEQFVGSIPEGLELDHLCRNRGCVNPEHLEPVTPRENNRRSPITNAAKTHCPQLHPYDAENTYRAGGRRHCRICQREALARFKARARLSAVAA